MTTAPRPRRSWPTGSAARLEFGTAGLRGQVAAGPNRMNRAVVRAATAALAQWLRGPGRGVAGAAAAEAGVVIGRDARHRSDEFADEAARVLAGAGIRVHLLPPRQPTPLLAFAVRHLGAAAGIMITASHNPPADNGYKLYLGDGAQIVPPADAEIEAAIRDLGPLSRVRLAEPDSPLIVRLGDEVAAAYLDRICAHLPRTPDAAWLRFVYTPAARGGGRTGAARVRAGRLRRPRTWSPPRPRPTPTSRPSRSPTRRSRGRSTWPWPRPGGPAPTW